jgi:hypothetical protein
MQLRLREEARALFLQKKNKELLSNEELDVSLIIAFFSYQLFVSGLSLWRL